MDAIVLLTALASGYVVWRYSIFHGFLNVYLPVLLLMPDYFRWDLPGIPDPTFSEAAILPVAGVFLFRYMSRWRFSLMDGVVILLTGTMAVSEYVNNGYKDAQNFGFNLLAMCVLPYMLAKGLVQPFGLGKVFAKRVAGLVFAVAVLSLYEFRFGVDPFRDIFQPFFPSQVAVWDTQLRWGFARIAGPFGSAILASVIFIISLLLQQWLLVRRAWSTPSQFDLGIPPELKPTIITGGLLLGVLLTMSRGPWLSLVFAAAVARVGWAKNLKKVCLIGGLGLLIAGGGVALGIMEYASVGRSSAASSEQETAAYRKELLDQYGPIAIKGGLLGYGRLTWPKVSGMPSIDNYYLLLMLMHGLAAVTLFLLMLIVSTWRLVRAAFQARASGRDTTTHFTLIGCTVTVAIAVATVYLDMQVMTLLYLMLGWGEGCVVFGTEPVRSQSPAEQPAQFKYVMT